MPAASRPTAGDSASACVASKGCAQGSTALFEPDWSGAFTCFLLHSVSYLRHAVLECADLREHWEGRPTALLSGGAARRGYCKLQQSAQRAGAAAAACAGPLPAHGACRPGGCQGTCSDGSSFRCRALPSGCGGAASAAASGMPGCPTCCGILARGIAPGANLVCATMFQLTTGGLEQADAHCAFACQVARLGSSEDQAVQTSLAALGRSVGKAVEAITHQVTRMSPVSITLSSVTQTF